MANVDKIKILVADDEGQSCRRSAKFLSEHGFEVETARNGSEAKHKVLKFRPRFVLADLMLPEINALALTKFIKSEHSLRHSLINVIVMSGHNNPSNVKQSFAAGALDYIVRPFTLEDLLQRLVFHSRSSRHLEEIDLKDYHKTDDASLMLHLTDLILREALAGRSLSKVLYNLTRMVSMKMEGVRCSIINVTDQENGFVVTSSDDPKATGIRLNLNKYPEVQNVMNTGRLVAIENIDRDPVFGTIKTMLKDINFSSLIVCPVERTGSLFGVLSLRMPPEKTSISDNEIRFVEIVANVASLVLNNQNFSTVTEYWKTGS